MSFDDLRKAPALGCHLPEVAPVSVAAIPSRYCLFDDGVISVMYAPFDHINPDARIMILGITPGLQQTRIAFETAILMRGENQQLIGMEVKRRAAFAGAMRANLISMLDELRVAPLLGIESTADLFSSRIDLLHSTSALRYPVFKRGVNYSGHSPKLTQHPFLVAMLDQLLAPELAAVPKALIVPLGKAVESALRYLVSQGQLSRERCLYGFPHPSGANAHRRCTFESQKDKLSAAAMAWLGSCAPTWP
ncbi:uracil-DNA glycosylase family protein [Cyanobium sp. NIES-981]|uniref:uracil-DNA glycosylase family protein n=1 Tax=Cyanobium sp. NIES-981 TaxID=1851505 RepID=UPI0007DDF6FA|nr:uracil-DNA glycosylase family protein [Cyanobium sp. NIES-981]SBO43399.1 Uracil-DNA glycosylase superfamily protein [Cyanobium sp. NIES-981]